MKIRGMAVWLVGLTFLFSATVFATEPVKVGVLSVLSGPMAELGQSDVNGAKLAVEEYGPLLGQKVEIVVADHGYNPGMAVTKAKEFYEGEKVDMIVACPQGAAAIAVSDQAAKNKRVFMSTSTSSIDLIARNRYTFKYNYNDYMMAVTAGLWGAEHLGKKWYVIGPDYVVGHSLLKLYTEAVKKKGGEIVGADMVALGTSDFSPYVLKAIKAEPGVLLILSPGKDGVNVARAAVDYGLKKGVKIIGNTLTEVEVKEAGAILADIYIPAPWYWKVDNPGAKEFADRYLKRFGVRPTFFSAAAYSATWQYLEAVKRTGTKEPEPVIKALENYAFRDMFANPGYIRAEDHLQTAKAFLLRIKKPEDVKEREDYFDVVGSVAADQAEPGPRFTGRKMEGF
jgi:branched-chain amino acid transport system substrate-binding protein